MFLAVSLVASRLSHVARARTQEAIGRRDELARLFDLSRDVLVMTASPEATSHLARAIGRRFDLEYVAIALPGSEGWSIATAGDGFVQLETLNDAVARATGVRVRETVPDTFLDRADEVINVDVTVEELRSRLREGKIYRPEKVEQALTNFFRKGNLSTLRELALRAVADEVGERRRAIAHVKGWSQRLSQSA